MSHIIETNGIELLVKKLGLAGRKVEKSDNKTFDLIVEVTLTTNLRQLSAESEPVRRHVSDILDNSSKPIYCLFIAPHIDNNIAESFRVGTYFKGNEIRQLKIVPISIKEFHEIFSVFQSKVFTPEDFHVFLISRINSNILA